MGQSGAQFPVAGVVFEDMDGTGQRIYPFRNGVTVRVAGLPFATRAAYGSADGRVPHRPHRLRRHLRAHRGPRPPGTALTREAVPADRFSHLARHRGGGYRAPGLGQDRNALIVAWARANL